MLYAETCSTPRHALCRDMLYADALCRDLLYAETCSTPRHALRRDMLYAETCSTPRHALRRDMQVVWSPHMQNFVWRFHGLVA